MELAVNNNKHVKTSSSVVVSCVNKSDIKHFSNFTNAVDSHCTANNQQHMDRVSNCVTKTQASVIQCNSNCGTESKTQCNVNTNGSDKCKPCISVSECDCDSGSHVGTKVQELGQSPWATISKKQLMQIDINLLHNRCQDLCKFMCQHSEHTGFIPLSPLQFVNIRQCNKCIVDHALCQDPIKLHKYVSSFKCPNFLGARVQLNFDINLDLVDELAKDYWDWQLPLYLRYGFPMDFKGTVTEFKFVKLLKITFLLL